MTRYHHTQPGYVIRVSMAVVLMIALTIGVATHDLIQWMPVSVILVVAAILFWNQTNEITEQELRWSFGPGLIHKSVPLVDIEHVELVKIRWWNGWGIHLTSNGWLYYVSGWDAVKVRLKGGKQFMLGTDEPQKFAEALRGVINS